MTKIKFILKRKSININSTFDKYNMGRQIHEKINVFYIRGEY